VVAGLSLLARAPVELAEVEVAVGASTMTQMLMDAD
jgi:hypothetical protein